MDKLRIFKIGGKVVEEKARLSTLLKDLTELAGHKILVHGGGRSVTDMSKKLGIEVQMNEGRRITDKQTLEVVKMMLAGVANKNVVSGLQRYGCNAIGLTGADGNTILANRRPPIDGLDYGYVGDIKKVNTTVLSHMLNIGIVPVFAAMTHDGKGQMLNTNADTIAASLAIAFAHLFHVELDYCFEFEGVLSNRQDLRSVIPVISRQNYHDLKASGIVDQGMIPKIDNAFKAVDAGVAKVRIMHAKDIALLQEGQKVGTIIRN
jgi:acetylglutamate kinase